MRREQLLLFVPLVLYQIATAYSTPTTTPKPDKVSKVDKKIDTGSKIVGKRGLSDFAEFGFGANAFGINADAFINSEWKPFFPLPLKPEITVPQETVAIPEPVAVPEPVTHEVQEVTIYKEVKVPVPVAVEREVRIPIPVHVDQPYPVYIHKPVPVAVNKPFPYKVKIPFPAPYVIEKKVPMLLRYPGSIHDEAETAHAAASAQHAAASVDSLSLATGSTASPLPSAASVANALISPNHILPPSSQFRFPYGVKPPYAVPGKVDQPLSVLKNMLNLLLGKPQAHIGGATLGGFHQHRRGDNAFTFSVRFPYDGSKLSKPLPNARRSASTAASNYIPTVKVPVPFEIKHYVPIPVPMRSETKESMPKEVADYLALITTKEVSSSTAAPLTEETKQFITFKIPGKDETYTVTVPRSGGKDSASGGFQVTKGSGSEYIIQYKSAEEKSSGSSDILAAAFSTTSTPRIVVN